MAKYLDSIRLSLQLETGLDGGGKPVYANRSFPGVAEAVADTEVYATVQMLMGLQKHPLARVNYIETYEIV